MYTALKETESRATDLLPYWKLPGADRVVPRLIKAAAAVQLIRDTTEMLVAKCRVRRPRPYNPEVLGGACVWQPCPRP